MDSLTSDGGGDYREGEKVEARFGGRSRWFKATVQHKNRDGTYYLRYADGDEERVVEKDLIRRLGKGGDGSKADQHQVRDRKGSDIETTRRKKHVVGDEIEARYKGGRKWYPGVIRGVNRDNTYDIRYADGDTERDVESSLVRNKGGSSMDSLTSDGGEDYREGEKVEARFGGRSRWFKATVQRKNRDGTYYLRYTDGDEERTVEKELIRRMKVERGGSKSPARRVVSDANSDTDTLGKKLDIGDEVEARYKGGGKWYPGVVRGVNRNGTFDIHYSDGDTELGVEARLIRKKGVASMELLTSDSGIEYKEGDKVEGRLGGRSHWFRATIQRKNRDGTYFLRYEDGDEERRVAKNFIRKVGRERSENRSTVRDMVSDSDDEQVGENIEARYRGRSKWFKGLVRRANPDGTYDIRYEDGDEEYGVESNLIHSLDSKATDTSSLEEYQEGDKVEARFRGRSHWFKARVKRNNLDGTFHLRYEDGDEETAVKKKLIHKVGSLDTSGGGRDRGNTNSRDSLASGVREGQIPSNSDISSKRYMVGDDVEAQLHGKSKWLLGRVIATHRDGTYDVKCSNDDREDRVRPRLIRYPNSTGEARGIGGHPGSTSDSEDKKKGRRAGEKVEARFRGKSKWFRGKVTRENADGTLDIRYDDGDEEKRVETHLVRQLENLNTKMATSGELEGDKRKGWERYQKLNKYQDQTQPQDRDYHKTREKADKRGVRKEKRYDQRSSSRSTDIMIAKRVKNALRRHERGVEDLKKRLERYEGRDSRGKRPLSVGEGTLTKVFRQLGVNLTSTETQILEDKCGNGMGGVKVKTLMALVEDDGRAGIHHHRGSGVEERPQTDRGRVSRVSSDASRRKDPHGKSTDGKRQNRQGDEVRRNSRTRNGEAARGKRRGVDDDSDNSSSSDLFSGSDSDGGRTSGGADSDGQRPQNDSYAALVGGNSIINKAIIRALGKLEGPALDGSLRQAFQSLNVGQEGSELDCASLKRLLHKLRIKLEDGYIDSLLAYLDTDIVGSIGLDKLIDASLCQTEPQDVKKIHLRMVKELTRKFRGEACLGALLKALDRLDTKRTGLTKIADIEKALEKVGVGVSSADVKIISERLDPEGRGRIDREAFCYWLASGVDLMQAEDKVGHQMALLKSEGVHIHKVFQRYDPDNIGEVR
ncbi:unnamed protein product [Choristocarpus tenellus]